MTALLAGPSGGRRRITVATPDILGEKMAGPAIRAHHFARSLAAHHDVELVSTTSCTLPSDERFAIRAVAPRDIPGLIARTDVWVVQGNVLLRYPQIARGDGVVVVDLYDPYHLENLEMSRDATPRDRLALVHNATVALNRSIARGDYFLVASDKQRDFWLGALAALGRVNPPTYDADPSLSSLFATVPFGLDDAPPTRGEPVLRGVVPGIGDDDVVLIWGGGLYNWFDPQTLVRAVARVSEKRPDVRLFFLATGHPNPSSPTMRTATATRALSDELGVTNRQVFFNEGWVPYDKRGAYLLEADIGVSTHLQHVETEFSFRTRILDYLWAGLPVVATDGDVFASVIRDKGLGRVAPAGDVAALEAALLELISDDALRARCAKAATETARDYTWSTAVAPLVEFCANPRRAPDLLNPAVARHLRQPLTPVRAPTPGPPGWRGEVALARRYLDEGGPWLLAKRVLTRVGKLARGRTE
ncbi:MAG TPA: glycosyltransferase family 4 protein [Acidothermaceae bacterium]